jgi:hypothetical protein
MLETLFVWAPQYAFNRLVTATELLELAAWHGYWNLLETPLFVIGMAVSLLFAAVNREVRPLLMPLVLIGCSGLMVLLQGKFYVYHWMAIWPFFALLAGYGLAQLQDALGGISRFWQRRLALTAMALLLVVLEAGDLLKLFDAQHALWTWKSGRLSMIELYARFTPETGPGKYSFAENMEAAIYIQQHTQPGESLFVWGFEPAIYYLAERQPASRFIYHYPVAARWTPAEWREELASDLAAARPSMVVVSHKVSALWMTGIPGTTAELLSTNPAVQQLLATNYQLETRIADFELYRALPTSTLPASTAP